MQKEGNPNNNEVDSKLRRIVSLLQATLESTAEGILVVDLSGNIVRYNQHFAELWKLEPKTLEKRNDEVALSAAVSQVVDPERFLSRVNEIYKNPEVETTDLIEFKDGKVFERLSRPQRMGNSIIGRVWSFRDITEAKKIEIQRERERKRNAFLAAAGTMLNSSLDYQTTLNGAAKAAIPNFADWSAVFLCLDGKNINLVAAEDVVPRALASFAKIFQGPPSKDRFRIRSGSGDSHGGVQTDRVFYSGAQSPASIARCGSRDSF